MSKDQWRKEGVTVQEEAAEDLIILMPHIGFLSWDAIDSEPTAVAGHHADSISFEDVFSDLHVVQLWKFTQTDGKRQLHMRLEASTIGTH